MMIYVVTKACPDGYYDDSFDGHVFSSKELASAYIDSRPGMQYCEVELDLRYDLAVKRG